MIITTSGALDALKHYGALHGGAGSMRRMAPLGEAGAEVLAAHVQGERHRGTGEQSRRMLEHLLLRCSEMFEETGIQTFHLDVRLHDNSYAVVAAAMTGPGKLHLAKRLAPHAHDRKGTAYRPAGRQ